MKINREIKIGLFAISMLVCLYLGINYLRGKDFFSNDRHYYTLFDNTRGLQTSAPVTMRGVKVGAVTRIAIDEAYPDKVVVTVNVKKEFRIPVDSHFKLFADGLMGSKGIELVRGTSSSYFERNALIPSETESGLLESASLGIEGLVAEAKTMIASLRTTSAHINEIFVQNAGALHGTLDNINSITRQVSEARLDGMVADLRTFTTMLKENSGRIEGIAGNLHAVTGDLAASNLRATLDTLGMGVSRLNTALGKLSDGGGTAARLLDDPAMYDSLVVAVGDLAALLEDLKANPGRYVHFSLFGKKR